ncbi:DUF2958 domain-containing protein [Burkholderia cepacia]|nr:DUF2958 domain-containing protein [Burkholderia cepacia]
MLRPCGGRCPLTAALRCAVLARVPGNSARATGDRHARLITDELRFPLLTNGREFLQNPDFDPAPVVRLFTPDAAAWLLTEIDPDDHDHAFGFCDLGLGMPELGWVSLQELATVRGQLGLPIERDLHFLTAYLTSLPPRAVLEDRLHRAAAQAQLEIVQRRTHSKSF